MALLKVTAGGKSFIVDSASKGTAKAFGRTKLEVEVVEASGSDVTDFLTEGGVIEKLEAKTKAPAETPAAEGAAA